ncbi:MAG TPA: glycosyltransferase family 39 protein [Candidatus Angelobacter sp.]
MTDRTRLLVSQLLLLLGACLFFFFFGLGAFGLVGADEPRYAQIAREMLARHDWVVPTLNGQPWLEKPVLLYWKEAAAYRVFGLEDWVARLPAAFFASALVLAVFFFMRRFRFGSELDSALITATMAGIVGFGRAASTDMLLAAPFCIALLAWWTWHKTESKVMLAGFYGLLGLAMLAKGPVAPALAVLIVAAYAWLRRQGQIFGRSLWPAGFAIFLLIVLPWYIAIQVKVPSFFKTFFLEHNLARFSTNLYRHPQPFWYYIPVFLLAVLPWIVFTVPALVVAVREGIRSFRAGRNVVEPPPSLTDATPQQQEPPSPEQPAQAAADDGLEQFLALWILIPIVFFSISQSKLPGYILPSIPPAAVLTAAYLFRTQGISRIKMMLHSLVCAALVAGALLVPWIMLRQPLPEATKTIIAVTTGVVAVFVLLVLRRGGLLLLRIATLAPLALGLIFLLRWAAPTIDEALSARIVQAELEQVGGAAGPVSVFNVKREVEYGLNFYRNQPIGRYEREGVPAGRHVVIAREGSRDAVQALAGERQVTFLGRYNPQHLEFFLVSNSK